MDVFTDSTKHFMTCINHENLHKALHVIQLWTQNSLSYISVLKHPFHHVKLWKGLKQAQPVGNTVEFGAKFYCLHQVQPAIEQQIKVPTSTVHLQDLGMHQVKYLQFFHLKSAQIKVCRSQHQTSKSCKPKWSAVSLHHSCPTIESLMCICACVPEVHIYYL